MERVKVKMLKDTNGSDTDYKGITMKPACYKKDQVYDLCESLGSGFVSMGVGEMVKGSGEKMSESIVENKMQKENPKKKEEDLESFPEDVVVAFDEQTKYEEAKETEDE